MAQIHNPTNIRKYGGRGIGNPTAGNGGGLVAPYFDMKVVGSGIIQPNLATTDLSYIADDLTAGSDWPSRVGSHTAAHVGSPTVGVETPFYPNGGFAGVGYRTSVRSFSSTKYYNIPYFAAAQLNGSSGATVYEIDLKTTVFLSVQTLVSCYISGSANYNHRIYIDTSGNLTVFWGGGTTSRTTTAALDKYSYHKVYVIFNYSTRRITIRIGGTEYVTSAATAGTHLTDGSTGIRIGEDQNSTSPANATEIIAIQRHQEEPDYYTRTAQWCGLPMGTAVVSDTRQNRAATIQINNKVWGMAKEILRVNEKGYRTESHKTYFTSNLLLNSVFRVAALASWTSSTAGTTTVTDDPSDLQSFYQCGGRSCKIDTDSSNSLGSVAQNITITGVSKQVTVQSWWRAATSGAQLYVRIKNNTTNNYWVSGSTWSASSTWVPCGTSSTALTYYRAVMTTEASGTGFTVEFGNGADAINASKTIAFYAAQVGEFNLGTMPELIITEAATLSTNYVNWCVLNQSLISDTKGRMVFEGISAQNDAAGASELSIGMGISVAGVSYSRLFSHNRSTGANTIYDETNTTTKTTAFTQDMAVTVQSSWSGSATSLVVNGATAVAGTYDGTMSHASGVLGIGCIANGDNNWCGFISRIRLYNS